MERCGAPAPQRDIPDACRDYPLRVPRGVVGPAGLEPASTPTQEGQDTGVGDDTPAPNSTSSSTPDLIAQLAALVRRALAAGTGPLPRALRQDLAQLLVGEGTARDSQGDGGRS